jgi:heat shock protein HslJ
MRHLILAAIAVLLLGACGAATSTTPPSTSPAVPGPSGVVPITADALAGRTFWSTVVVGRDLVAGTRVTLTFNQDGTIGASAGCNSMGGTWSVDGTTLRISIGQMTEMGCPDDRFAQDDWLGEFLASGLTATLNGDELVLDGAGVTMTLLDREVADPDQALEGTTWVLDGIQTGAGNDGTVSSVPSGVRAIISLDGGLLSVETGCNTGSAPATLDGSTLTIGPITTTLIGCEGDPATVERLMTQYLQGAVTVEIEGQALRLMGPAGGLSFQAE